VIKKRIAIISFVFTALAVPVFGGENETYLALGDSVPFGNNVTLLPPYSQTTPKASDFVGYPETVAAALKISEVNAACPGETSASFLNTSAPDNGCNSPHVVLSPTPPNPPQLLLPPFKTTIGLHARYAGSQMAFALSELQSNPNIDLITLSIGANDLLLVLPQLLQCGPDAVCQGGVLTPVLNAYGANLASILLGIRSTYHGTLILMTYYSPSPDLDLLTQTLNGTMTFVASQLNLLPNFTPVTVVDGFTAFQNASAPSHDACQAGLVIPLPASPYNFSACDVHPTAAGRSVLAGLVELAAPSTGTACNGTYYGTFVGNLKVSAGQTCMFIGGGVTGNISLNGGNLVLNGTTVSGNVQAQAGGTVSLGGFARILGNLQFQNLPDSAAQNSICGVTVTGNLMYQNNAAPAAIGGGTLCPGNTVSGNVQIQNNIAAVGVTGNSIGKTLLCSGNSSISGSGNMAGQKQGQCAAF
jgi:lysophospholipase L1-like esterase